MRARVGIYQAQFSKALGGALSLSWIDEMRPRVAKFVLDEYPPQAIRDFGIDLVQEGLFELPFPNCYFEWPAFGTNGKVETMLVLDESTDDGAFLGWWASNSPGEWGISLPFRMRKEKLRQHLSLNDGNIKGYAHRMDDITGQEGMGECTENSIREILDCVSLLACRGIEKEVIRPRESVNKKRVKDGRSPLPSYTLVHLNRYRKKEGKGTHASPCPHFRRGHVRLLPSGKRTLVSPAIVMADPGVMPTYKVPEMPVELKGAA